MPPKAKVPIASVPERVYQRLVHNADRDEPTGCLISRYSVGSHGYAQIGWQEPGDKRSRVTLAHRAVWIYTNGPIPEGMTIDHRQGLCSRKCIEITHLRMISNLENARRNQGKDWPAGAICWRGHDEGHLVPKRRGKHMGVTCGTCDKFNKSESQRRRRAAKREQD